MKFRFLGPASAELDDAVAFYNAQRSGLGYEFAAAVESSLSRIALFPDGYPPISSYLRRCLVPRFPYGVIYQLRKSNFSP